MSKERSFRRELKKIARVLEGKKRQYSDLDYQNPVNIILDNCLDAQKIIDNSRVKEKHKKPHPFLARHLSLNVNSSKELEKKGYKNNSDLIKYLALHSLANFIIGVSENGSNIQEKIKLCKYMKDSKDISLEEKMSSLGLSFSDVEECIDSMMIGIVKTLLLGFDDKKSIIQEMQELTQQGEYKSGLIELFQENWKRFKELKDKFYSKSKFVKDGKEISEREIKEIALDYALCGLSLVTDHLKEESIANSNSLHYTIFSNHGLTHLEDLRNFLETFESNERKYKSQVSGFDNLTLQEKIGSEFRFIEKTKGEFSDYMSRTQDEVCEIASEKAKQADENYKKYLKKFVKMSLEYSRILEEEPGDVSTMLNVLNPDFHVIANEEAKRQGKKLPLYGLYKQIPDVSLTHNVLKIQLNYIRAKIKRKENKSGIFDK